MAANLAHQLALVQDELRSPRAWMLLLFCILLARYSLATYSARRARKRQAQAQHDDDGASNLVLPPSPPALPVLGHLHLVGSLPHISFRRLARKHGSDVMLLRLGARPVVVVSSPRAAEAVLRTHDRVCASRPYSLVAEVVMYGPSDVGFVPYGDYWRRSRKLITTHLLAARRVQALRAAREQEVSAVMARVGEAAAAGAAVDMGELLGSFAHGLVCRAVMGNKSFRGDGRDKLLRELASDTSPLLGGFNVEELFPFLARFGVLSRAVRAKSERLRRRWDEQLDRLIQDHESTATARNDDDEDDFIHILLSVRHEYGLTREQMKAILLDVFFGGIDTTATILEFTVAELMRNPDVMKKLQAEVRSVVPEGQGAVVSDDNLRDMAYLRAVVKESLRLHPPSPVLTPHFTMASCSVDGFAVPAGMSILINAWAIATDARFWEDPEAFAPERFLDGGGSAAGVDFRGADYQLLPFGSGRRMCPGINFGVASVEAMLANLVHRFDWELPPGQAARDVDMTEVFGLVLHRKHKLLLLPRQRL